MRALQNILGDLAFQFRVNGALLPRLLCVLAYYFIYGLYRVLGREQGDSRLRALWALQLCGLSTCSVRVQFPREMRMETDLFTAAFMLREFLKDRVYEHWEEFVPKTGETIADVGAHHGAFTLGAAQRVGPQGQVVAIEAFEGNIELLRRNLSLNGIKNTTAVCAAAGSEQREATLYTTPLVTGGHSVVIRTEGPVERLPTQVQMRTLDDILHEIGIQKIDLIKIDVEGACLSVLQGATRTLSTKPRLVMEVEGAVGEQRKVREFLESSGYVVKEYQSILYAS